MSENENEVKMKVKMKLKMKNSIYRKFMEEKKNSEINTIRAPQGARAYP